MGADEIRALLGELTAAPDDLALRTRIAEQLEVARAQVGEDGAASLAEIEKVLAPLVNLAGHDEDTGLPCLCRDCLPRAGIAAEHEGTEFVRSFVVVGKRVLHFWMLAAQRRKRASVRASVRAALEKRLALPARKKGARKS